jgi:hypothetical protein
MRQSLAAHQHGKNHLSSYSFVEKFFAKLTFLEVKLNANTIVFLSAYKTDEKKLFRNITEQETCNHTHVQ